ncbi:hypothetical protein Nhal_3174 [Nitrosococcus halophilus Nc 4]|uniref:Uncharacterized protein n=1 Tax=Nitrosococcus halophilus (strain Nc4) TaxID=472759 RepID=D5BZX9_NITHN|nr:hypothetical protein [Nitrosococcus halophilus]ADE16226.1 hypothetical protein Nhal_3174 [Nitrosococcus halophilus Nc 4]
MKGRLNLSVSGNGLAGNGLKALLMHALFGPPAEVPIRSRRIGPAYEEALINKQPVGRIKRRVSGKT